MLGRGYKMIKEATIFNSPFGDIRVIVEDHFNLLFVAKDVVKALGYENATNAMKQHCKGVVKFRSIKDNRNYLRGVRVIDKSDYYRLVFNSKLKSAIKYQNLIFEEILKNNFELIKLMGYDIRETREKINVTVKIEE